METHLSQTIDIVNDNARYDTSVKEMLADKQVFRNILIAMLEELLKKDSVDAKKQKLVEQYGFIMNDETGRRLDVMCNLSEVVMEKGEARLNNLNRLLVEQNRIDDLQKAITDEEYRSLLYEEFNL